MDKLRIRQMVVVRGTEPTCLVVHPMASTLRAWIAGWRVLGDPTVRRRCWLAPVHDALVFFISVAAFFSNRIEWRGRSYQLHRGRLVPVRRSAAEADQPARYLRA